MNIAIIGAGNVGSALGINWASKGHRIIFGVPDPSSDKYETLKEQVAANAAFVTPEEAAKQASIIFLATPWQVTESAVKSLGNLTGKTLVDCTNPLVMTEAGLQLDRGFDTSGAETVQQWAVGANVIKSLNQVGAEIMQDPSGFAHKPVMFVAGDDTDAKTLTIKLVGDLGFEALDAGPLKQARILEPFGMTWINQALFRGHGRNWAFGALPRL